MEDKHYTVTLGDSIYELEISRLTADKALDVASMMVRCHVKVAIEYISDDPEETDSDDKENPLQSDR